MQLCGEFVTTGRYTYLVERTESAIRIRRDSVRMRKGFAGVISVLVLEGCVLAGLFAVAPATKTYGTKYEAEETAAPGEGADWPEQEDREQEVWEIYQKNKKKLVLVNAEHELEEGYDASLRKICNGRLKASTKIYSSLVDMLEAAEDEGHQYFIASAWRSREKQQKLVDEDVRKAMGQGSSYKEALEETYKETMPAGHSEHETGLALDILCKGNLKMNTSQAEEPANKWLRKNSWRYGFILRYPKGKKKITGINYEPWHFRYVGKEAAAYMHRHNLTLEEFWEKLGK